jgi:hypothetical protein
MRQGQTNRRNRGRGRNRSGNPVTRTYESSGPDVKIKGTAAHIAEKYQALARDALSSGHTVTAENYLQHAEHYNRIIMAAQARQEEMGKQRRQPLSQPVARQSSAPEMKPPEPAEIPGSGEQPELPPLSVEIEAVVPKPVAKAKRKTRQTKVRPRAKSRARVEAVEPVEKIAGGKGDDAGLTDGR